MLTITNSKLGRYVDWNDDGMTGYTTRHRIARATLLPDELKVLKV
jgi:hypothetical protein